MQRFARSSTGKMLMMALIDESRKYEAAGLIRRYMRHELACLMLDTDDTLITDSGSALEHSYNEKNSSEARRCCHGALVRDIYSQELVMLKGPVILAFGGMNGLFPSETTGTVTNSADAAALCFIQGIRFSNLEMIQYHPTTISIAGKRCLVSEAARGEGGRLFVMRDGSPWHFMEELHPEMGNLSPRDVVAREMFFVARGTTSLESTKRSCKGNAIVDNAEVDKSDPGNDGAVDQIWLDMRHLSKDVWDEKLPDLRKEIIHYLGIDPSKEPVPVEPGIHYFMGGIDVDTHHRTSAEGLYAAGECCSQYHGANRLGGNSTMGAIYGGYAAAKDICTNFKAIENVINEQACAQHDITFGEMGFAAAPLQPEYDHMAQKLKTILMQSMGIVREEETLLKALAQIRSVLQNVPEAEPYDPQYPGTGTKAEEYSKYNICKKYDQRIIARFLLAQAMLESAVLRKESRGAHFRSDHPETKECFRGMTVCEYINNRNGNLQDGFINTWFRESV